MLFWVKTMINKDTRDSSDPKQKAPVHADDSGSGFAIGLSLGVLVGIIIDDIGLGMMLGVAMGLCVGLAVGALGRNKKAEEQESDDEKQ